MRVDKILNRYFPKRNSNALSLGNARATLPKIIYNGAPIVVGLKGSKAYVEYNGGTHFFVLDSRLMLIVILLLVNIMFYPKAQSQVTHVYHYTGGQQEVVEGKTMTNVQEIYSETKHNLAMIPSSMPDNKVHEEIENNQEKELPTTQNEIFKIVDFEETDDFRKKFIREKQALIYNFTTQNSVVRVDQLSDDKLLELNHLIGDLYKNIVLNNLNVADHVQTFFTDTTELYKVKTALMEQAKYHVPASITLSQAALETSYGRKVIDNNYFGIKDKSKLNNTKTTTEYYTASEAKGNAYKILSKQKVVVNGKAMYKCKIKDHFAEYISPWQSFRAHSVYLFNNKRYAPLFKGGKSFEAWADKIGSSKQGGVGYATDPVYGNLLKKIIKRYHLDLLDH